MAEDILNDGSEEDRKSSDDQFGDDFGLPDLEFDDLQELDLGFGGDSLADDDENEKQSDPIADSEPSLDFDMSLLESSDTSLDLDSPSHESILEQGIDELEDVLDSAQLISDRLGDDLDSDHGSSENGVDTDSLIDDLMNSVPDGSSLGGSQKILDDDESSSSLDMDDLFAGIDSPDDLAALGFADEDEDSTNDLFAADTFDDSPAAKESKVESGGALFSVDDDLSMDLSNDEDSIFGSDDLSMDAAERTGFEPSPDTSLPPNYKEYSYKESSGGFTKYIIVGVVLIAAVAIAMLKMGGTDEDREPKKVTVKKVVPKKKDSGTEEAVVAELPAEQEEVESVEKAKPVATPTNKKPVVASPKVSATKSSTELGAITKIDSKTSQSYIIIGSFIDEDLAMDFAKDLVKDGSSVKIIMPYGKSKRYRVSIADYSTYGDAVAQMESYKGQFGDQIWALKY